MKITRETAAKKILSTNGKIFSVQFIKKNGEVRDMTCRLGVQKFLKGGKSTTAHIPNLINVCELTKQQYRCVNTDTLIKLKVAGEEYSIINEELTEEVA
jgi:hypothetical protein